MVSPSERPVVEPLGPAVGQQDEARAREAERELGRWRGRVDLEALLVALVLVPQSYPRNRFFSLYQWPGARDVRRRAALLRSVIADLVGEAEQVNVRTRGAAVALRYQLVELGLHRTTMLARDELALVKLAAERAARDAAVGGGARCRQIALAPLYALVDDREVERLGQTLERLFAGGRTGES